jgi:hypothetical protein
MSERKIVFKDGGNKLCEFNPPYIPLEGHTFWIFEGGKIIKLCLNPKEWCWKKRVTLHESNLFGHTTKTGYREIIFKQGYQLSYDGLQQSKITYRQRKIIFSKLWHLWIPHKVSTIIWLMLVNGLEIGKPILVMKALVNCVM